jgi:hypothetical protein
MRPRRLRVLLMSAERRMLPIACTLTPGAGRAQRDAWHAFNADHLLEVDRRPGSITVHYATTDDASRRLTALVQTEQICCAFATWVIDASGPDLRLIVSGTPDALASLTFVAEP